jgi:hypothetical protein
MKAQAIITAVATAALALVMVPMSAVAQNAPKANVAAANAPKKSPKEMLVGSWTLLLVDNQHPDGTSTPVYGPNPMGTVIFTTDGHYSLQIMRNSRPKFASNNRLTGTTDEDKAAVQGMISHFGRYDIDEAGKTITFHIEGSSFPNWDSMHQKRAITALSADALTWTNPTPAAPSSDTVNTLLAWRRLK